MRPAPGLAIQRIELRWSPATLLGLRASSLDVFGARLRGAWADGRLSAGPLDVFLRQPAARPPAGAPPLPVDVVRFHDLRLDVQTPAGSVAARGDLELTVEVQKAGY